MGKPPARYAMLGWAATLLLGGTVASACNSVLGYADFNANGCPEEGRRRCDGKVPQVCGANGAWQNTEPACQHVCILGQCEGVCAPGTTRCATSTRPQTCNGDGEWKDADRDCVEQTCIDGVCAGVCAPEQKSCLENTPQTCNAGQWTGAASCDTEGKTCVAGDCIGECIKGEKDCDVNTNTPLTCDDSGQWQDALTGACADKTCVAGACQGVCAPGRRCAGNTPQTCDNGVWVSERACPKLLHCEAGQCVEDCTPGDLRCDGNTPQKCVAGSWQDQNPCIVQTCVAGACQGVCAPLDAQCVGQTPQTCDASGQWKNQTACTGACIEGSCPGGSCSGLPETCGPARIGPSGNESCCLSPLVPGGSYYRSNDTGFEATVSDFRLDRFEVTVGRFRKFVEEYPGSKPANGAGKHPLIPNSGWDAAEWDGFLPSDQVQFKAALKCGTGPWTWTDAAGANENLPINCVDWYIAFAFCVWDGGRLPTESEWNYAAAGGSEQRQYPWSNPPSSQTIDGSHAAYGCLGGGDGGNCLLSDILNVGSKSQAGDGKYRQADLAGNMQEWTLDAYQEPYPSPCDNCAALELTAEWTRVTRGGGWKDVPSFLRSSYRDAANLEQGSPDVGIRCARSP